MNIVSAPFLFLFLPLSVVVYYLIPRKRGLLLRNIFLFLASMFFYTWGEPIYVIVLVGLILLTWLFGKMAYGKYGTRIGKTAVFLTVFSNAFVLVVFSKFEQVLSLFSSIFEKDLSILSSDIPLGFSFFIFSSISYVVDIYRGQCKSSGTFLQTALYTSLFFRVLQGPIVSYRKFECQINDRGDSFDALGDGVWRVGIGLCKKVIIADSVYYLVQYYLSLDYGSMSVLDAWLGCISFLVYMYFDFAGYSDMAIGLAKLYGYSIPENFNYPYISKSVSEFWRRWHMTLCVWFTEYLYYPVLLGPSIKLRKLLKRVKVSDALAKSLQNIFVVSIVWFVTALWHGLSLNYVIWGLLNCTCMLIEPHFKPLKNKTWDYIVRHLGFALFIVISMPLISIETFGDAMQYYKALFVGTLELSSTSVFYLKSFGSYLIIGLIGCFPVLPKIKEKFIQEDLKKQKIWDVCAGIVLVGLVLVSLSFIFTRDTIVFLYQQ